MSDGRVRAALEQMEAWLRDLDWEPDVAALRAWDEGFKVALAGAEKGPGWSALMERAQEAGRRLEARTVAFAETRDLLRHRLEAQDRGGRALRGYGASAR